MEINGPESVKPKKIGSKLRSNINLLGEGRGGVKKE
jgi:hypothetical protein